MYELELTLSPKEAANDNLIKQLAAEKLKVSDKNIVRLDVIKRSLDARRHVQFHLKVKVWLHGEPLPEPEIFTTNYPNVSNKERVIIIGAGPAGLFAGLRLVELGIKPVILERGKDVQARRRDLAAINKEHIVNPDSNYCFGEGGAGTYSDGKLYTRSKKRGSVERILKILVSHGAREDILVDTHPHIGTNKLPKIITAIRETLLNAGAEVHFNTRVEDLVIDQNSITGVIDASGETHRGSAVILATGHSARDVFELLQRKEIKIEAKPFAIGVRVEHPQQLVDRIQYNCADRGPYLPAAAYSLTHQVGNRGVYSFCMCPGGFIVPSATAPGEVVVNGMSPSKRDSRFANSGIVVALELRDFHKYQNLGALSGMNYQRMVEQLAFEAGGRKQSAPAQRLMDFINNKQSLDIPETSYQPGTLSAPLHELLPDIIRKPLQEGFKAFGKKLHGYLTNEACILGVESRTSSPVRIPRDKSSLEHPEISGLYPCGEGAGYAGGIISAAIDGERCAEMSAKKLLG